MSTKSPSRLLRALVGAAPPAIAELLAKAKEAAGTWRCSPQTMKTLVSYGPRGLVGGFALRSVTFCLCAKTDRRLRVSATVAIDPELPWCQHATPGGARVTGRVTLNNIYNGEKMWRVGAITGVLKNVSARCRNLQTPIGETSERGRSPTRLTPINLAISAVTAP